MFDGIHSVLPWARFLFIRRTVLILVHALYDTGNAIWSSGGTSLHNCELSFRQILPPIYVLARRTNEGNPLVFQAILCLFDQ